MRFRDLFSHINAYFVIFLDKSIFWHFFLKFWLFFLENPYFGKIFSYKSILWRFLKNFWGKLLQNYESVRHFTEKLTIHEIFRFTENGLFTENVTFHRKYFLGQFYFHGNLNIFLKNSVLSACFGHFLFLMHILDFFLVHIMSIFRDF